MPNPSRETKFSGANADRNVFIFPVQLTTCRIGNLTGLIHTLARCVTIDTYIYVETPSCSVVCSLKKNQTTPVLCYAKQLHIFPSSQSVACINLGWSNEKTVHCKVLNLPGEKKS